MWYTHMQGRGGWIKHKMSKHPLVTGATRVLSVMELNAIALDLCFEWNARFGLHAPLASQIKGNNPGAIKRQLDSMLREEGGFFSEVIQRDGKYPPKRFRG
jgi:hypothetical protein